MCAMCAIFARQRTLAAGKDALKPSAPKPTALSLSLFACLSLSLSLPLSSFLSLSLSLSRNGYPARSLPASSWPAVELSGNNLKGLAHFHLKVKARIRP